MQDLNGLRNPGAVVVTGLGICTPLGRGEADFAHAVLTGATRFQRAKGFDGSKLVGDLIAEFDPNDIEFGLSKEDLRCLDRGAWFALDAARQALGAAKFEPGSIDARRVSVVLGTSHSGIQHIEKIFLRMLADDLDGIHVNDLYAAMPYHATAELCRDVLALGPSLTISSACASSNTAMGIGYDLLRTGEADVVLVVGTDTVSESIVAGFNCLRAMSREPVAPFSNPSGITLGEGAGALVLERLEQARRRGVVARAELLGYGLSGDAYHETATDLEGKGVEVAVRNALDDAGIDASLVDYVSAHGTGTDANDIPESMATERIFGRHTPMSSPKAIVGHTLGASGIIEAILTLLHAERDLLPPTLNFKGVRAGCADLDYIPNQARSGSCRTFVCNNYGFGGNNSSIVVSRDIGFHTPPRRTQQRVVLSGYGLCLPGNMSRASGALHGMGQAPRTGEVPDAEGPAVRMGPVALGKELRAFSRSSPMIKFALMAVGDLIESGHIRPLLSDHPLDTAIVGGITLSAQRAVEKFMESVFKDGAEFASATQFPMTTTNAATGQVSIAYGIKGYNTTFVGAPGALYYATSLVASGRQARAMTFGSDELTADLLKMARRFGWGAGDAVEMAGQARLLGEGAAAVLLEGEVSARGRGADILAIVAGQGLTQDGMGWRIDATGSGLLRAAQSALAKAGLSPEDIDLVVAHRAGTESMVAAQQQAFAALFGEDGCALWDPLTAYGYGPSMALPALMAAAAEAVGGRGGSAIQLPASSQRALVLFTSIGGDHYAAVIERA